jgi:damage-control phosphatase, subfamily I
MHKKNGRCYLSYFNDLKFDSRIKPLQPDPRCTNCLSELSDDVIRMVGGKALTFQEHIRSETKKILADAEKGGWSSPETANEILREIRGVSGVDDPYEKMKSLEMARAKEVFAQVKHHVRNDLRSVTNLAVLGNNLDFFRSMDDAFAGVSEQAGSELVYFHDDLDRLQDSLVKEPGLVLYLTDNAGEIFFDIPLFQYIQNLARRTVLVVKGGPGLNDLTGVELESAAISGMFGETMDTGTDGAGIDWRHVSPAFASLVDKADLIVAKGMANFETVYFRELSTPVFFLFRAKCQVVADYFKAPMDSMIALWKDNANLTP